MKVIFEITINYNPYRIIQNQFNELYVQAEIVGLGVYETVYANSDSKTRRENYCKVICEAIGKNIIKLVPVT